jgi:hypothetical protein
MIFVANHNFLIYLLNNNINMSTNMNVCDDKDFTVLINNMKTILAEINY